MEYSDGSLETKVEILENALNSTLKLLQLKQTRHTKKDYSNVATRMNNGLKSTQKGVISTKISERANNAELASSLIRRAPMEVNTPYPLSSRDTLYKIKNGLVCIKEVDERFLIWSTKAYRCEFNLNTEELNVSFVGEDCDIIVGLMTLLSTLREPLNQLKSLVTKYSYDILVGSTDTCIHLTNCKVEFSTSGLYVRDNKELAVRRPLSTLSEDECISIITELKPIRDVSLKEVLD